MQTYEERAAEVQRYKKILIDGILDFQTKGQYTAENLRKKSIRELERIHDYVE